MRLFVAVTLPPIWKDRMDMATYYLRTHTEHCIPTPRGTYHLTLSFIGETDRLRDVIDAMDRVDAAPFTLTSSKIGQFHVKEGDLWWMGMEPTPALLDIQSRLDASLQEAGFDIGGKPYVPHASLARQVVPTPDLDVEELQRLLPPMSFQVNYLTLFRSDWDRGNLFYTPLHRHMLQISTEK
ncbi:RNA 2',3'-cyclic phosphodiesterase [Pseudoflavonifractor sp. MSJ-37]|uniref:RNA 2',3'-cyclic phosphodiesterase n=1 Tax=Pseudoflavonifractor sp. MSJ-37 TaxID=2841531 RepID=UPI001C10BD03|nr:RNA 2',3'-cyclic phosphodiesterase [Pseudoflavonifractor sp. MSJ-37]MBU5434020.1 RNA 2',3'-cyclic phosphodiesterase [Pseudoflavonifractor sp. MSJ-37]